ncbi:MAG: tetratricopeptide repeat protein [Microcoleaceae cyanobacterium]
MFPDFTPTSETSNPSPKSLTQAAEYYRTRGKWSEALIHCQQAIRQFPNYAPAQVTLGSVRYGQGDIGAAIACYQTALTLDANLAEAHTNLGSMFYKTGELELAIERYRQAIAIKPELTAAYWNLGLVLRQQGKFVEAEAIQQQASTQQLKPTSTASDAPTDPTALFQAGNRLAEQGKLAEAIEQWQQVIRLHPDFAEAYCQLGTIFRHQGKPQSAIPMLEKALELQPTLIPAHQHLCGITRDAGDFAAARQAVSQYRHACGDQDPIMTAIYSISIHQVSGLNQIAREQFLELEAQLEQALPRATRIELKSLYANLLFSQPYLRDDPERNFHLRRKIAEPYLKHIIQPKYVGSNTKTSGPRFSVQSSPDSKPDSTIPMPPSDSGSRTGRSQLKVGVISNHFKRHSVGWCSADVLAALSQRVTGLYLYSTDRLGRDDQTEKFEQMAQKFYQPIHYPNGQATAEEILKTIQADQIDILLDLDSLSMPLHTEILSQQPAEICLSWLGFEAPCVCDRNYFMGDWHTHPQGYERYMTEKLIRMPETFMAVSGFERQSVDPTAFRRAHRIGQDQVVYLCVAPGRKFSQALAEAQISILQQVPNSVLIHKAAGDRQVFQAAYWKCCEAKGISKHRVKFFDQLPTEEEHRKIYAIADILLDSYPYNGGTHSLEALWFGVPIITLKGQQFLSRMGYAFLQGTGVQFGAARSWAEYVEYGVRLGNDRALRQLVQSQLAQAKHPETLAPLWNPDRFAENLVQILEKLSDVR